MARPWEVIHAESPYSEEGSSSSNKRKGPEKGSSSNNKIKAPDHPDRVITSSDYEYESDSDSSKDNELPISKFLNSPLISLRII